MPARATANNKWQIYCAYSLVAVADSLALRDYFVKEIDFTELAGRLRAARSLSGESAVVPLITADGKQYAVSLREAKSSGLLTLELTEGDTVISSLEFNPDRPRRRVFLKRAETGANHSGKGAHNALIKVAFHLYPEVELVESHLAWVNFKKVAEGLGENRNLGDMLEAERTVEAALSTPEQLAAAVPRSPTGKSLEALGFVVNPESFVVFKSEITEGKGPILTVRWNRPAAPALLLE